MSMSNNMKKELLSWGKTFFCGVVLALFVSNYLVVNASVISGSMETTIMTGDRVFGNRLAYLTGEPERYDVVIFQFPDNPTVSYVKRIIGLPGETLEVIDGKVYINGSETPLRDDFVQGAPYGSYGPFEIPEGHYFMMGDNRNNSFDSKNWENHYVSRDQILGKLLIRYYPHLGFIDEVEDA